MNMPQSPAILEISLVWKFDETDEVTEVLLIHIQQPIQKSIPEESFEKYSIKCFALGGIVALLNLPLDFI